MNSKFDEFKRSRDQILNKLDSELQQQQQQQYDLNKNSVPLTTSRSASKLLSRPSL